MHLESCLLHWGLMDGSWFMMGWCKTNMRNKRLPFEASLPIAGSLHALLYCRNRWPLAVATSHPLVVASIKAMWWLQPIWLQNISEAKHFWSSRVVTCQQSAVLVQLETRHALLIRCHSCLHRSHYNMNGWQVGFCTCRYCGSKWFSGQSGRLFSMSDIWGWTSIWGDVFSQRGQGQPGSCCRALKPLLCQPCQELWSTPPAPTAMTTPGQIHSEFWFYLLM